MYVNGKGTYTGVYKVYYVWKDRPDVVILELHSALDPKEREQYRRDCSWVERKIKDICEVVSSRIIRKKYTKTLSALAAAAGLMYFLS